MSESALKALSNSELASGTEIPATKHRTVNDAIIEEMFDGQSRGDVLAAVQSALSLSAGDKVFVIRSGQAYLLDANSFGLVSKFVDLEDVQITAPVNDQAVTYNAALNKYVLKDIFLDVSWQEPIISFLNFTTSEPASPTTGDRYVNTVTGSGSVSTGETFTINYIYEWNGVDWTETVPLQGYTLVNNDDSLIYNFNGTSWVAASSGALPSNVAYKDIDNNFSTGQTINGTLLTTSSITAISYNVAGASLALNTTTPYGQWQIEGSRGGYSGILDVYSGVVTMFDSTGSGGWYRETGGGWYLYWNQANFCLGIGAQTTNASYSIHAGKGAYLGGDTLVVGNVTATTFTGNGSSLTNVNAATLGGTAISAINTFHSVADLGTNQTGVSASSARELDILAGLYNASTTLTFSDVTNLRRCAIQVTNTNANVLTFAGITVKFVDSELPSGMSFASNALTFPADTAVVYNVVLEKFNGTTFRGRIELDG